MVNQNNLVRVLVISILTILFVAAPLVTAGALMTTGYMWTSFVFILAAFCCDFIIHQVTKNNE